MNKYFLQLVSGILILFASLLMYQSCSENKNIESESPKVVNGDSLDAVNRAIVQAQTDSFYNTPEGKLELERKKEDSIRYARESVEEQKRLKEEEEREKRILSKYQKVMDRYGCNLDEAQMFLDHQIWIGMPIKMVVAYRGLPEFKETHNFGDGNNYIYCWYDYDPSCFYCDQYGIVSSYF